MSPNREPFVRTARWVAFRLAEIVRNEGWRGIWFRALVELGYRRWAWFERSLETPPTQVEARVPVSFGELDVRHRDDYLAFRRGSTAEQFASRLAQDRHCYAAWQGDRLVAVTWVATDVVRIRGLAPDIPLAPGEFYLLDAFTRRDVRGKRVQGALCAWIFERYRKEGYRRVVSLIVPENRASIANRSRSGLRRTGTVGCIRIGPLRRRFMRGAPAVVERHAAVTGAPAEPDP